MNNFLNQTAERVLDVLYPRRCPVCHGVIGRRKILVCPGCREVFQPVGKNYCMKCGRPVAPETEYCSGCRQENRSFDRGRGVFLYDGKMRQSLIRYKYYGSREYADYYAAAILQHCGSQIKHWNPDVIVPVPLYAGKQRVRGFNQSAYLALRMGRALSIPVAEGLLEKTRDTKSQKKLDAVQRKRNLLHAFRVNGELSGLTILLVDDVYTTGSTVDAAAACLKAAGAEKVFFITLCIGRI